MDWWNNDVTDICSNIGPFFNHVINICAVVAFYSLIIFKMFTSRYENNDRQNLRSISITLFLLTFAYIAFLSPMMAFESCSPWGTTEGYSKGVRAGIASW